MNTRNLAALIESYLEADDSTDGPSNAMTAPAVPDSATRQKLGQLMQLTDQLKQDSDKMKQEIASLRSNLQMSALMPLLLNQKMTVESATDAAGNPIFLPSPVQANETIQFKQGDILSALLPVMLMGGFGSGDSGNGGSDNSMNMLMLVLAISGKL